MKQARILAVDDTPSIIDFIRGVLEPEGCKVYVAANGKRGVELCALLDPDLVLLDVMMPGMDGFEACRLIKAAPGGANRPVLFLSALGAGFDVARAFEAGAADYLTKPVEPAELLARMRTQLSLAELRERKERDALVRERTAELTSSLEERDELLREINHRVKNNLQLLTAIVGQQAALQGDTGGFLSRLLGRIDTIAFLYEQLWFSRRLNGIAMDEYLSDVARSVLCRPGAASLDLRADLAKTFLPLDMALPCGLIAHELLDNAARWAYGSGGGPLYLSLSAEPGRLVLEVGDEGSLPVPFPAPAGGASALGAGLGFRFIDALADQLDAEVTRRNGPGFRLSLRFPVPQEEGPPL